jgi:hypothetical protein
LYKSLEILYVPSQEAYVFPPIFLTVGLLAGQVARVEVGFEVGVAVGVEVGFKVGGAVGLEVGVEVGFEVGVAVGLEVGVAVGVAVGLGVGEAVGLEVGDPVKLKVGLSVLKRSSFRSERNHVLAMAFSWFPLDMLLTTRTATTKAPAIFARNENLANDDDFDDDFDDEKSSSATETALPASLMDP